LRVKQRRDPAALPRLTARVNPTIHGAMLRIVRAAEGWSDDGWSDIVNLGGLGGLGGNTSHLSRFESQTKYMRTLKLLILPLP